MARCPANHAGTSERLEILWEQFVKGWDGTASDYEVEPFHLHGNKKWHLQCVFKFVAGATVDQYCSRGEGSEA